MIVESKDNRPLAIAAMLICVFSMTGQAAFFKLATKSGAIITDFQIIRGSCVFTMACLILCKNKINPLRKIPKGKHAYLLLRGLFGNFAFFTMNFGIILIPISLGMTIFQTYPIFISIFGSCINKEPIALLDITSILVCFTALLIMTFT